jgi:hypothetical protein
VTISTIFPSAMRSTSGEQDPGCSPSPGARLPRDRAPASVSKQRRLRRPTASLLRTTTSLPAQSRANACFPMAPFAGSVIRPWARGCRRHRPSYPLKSRARLPAGPTRVRFQSGNSRDFALKAGHRRHLLARQKQVSCWQSACASASRRPETGPAAKRRVHPTRRKPPFAGNSGSFELLTSCEGTQKVMSSILRAGPVSVRNRALARAGPTDLQDNRLGPERQPVDAPPSSSERLLVVHRRS